MIIEGAKGDLSSWTP